MAIIKIDIQNINEQLGRLVHNRSDVALDQIPEAIRDEFINDIAGKTIYKKGDQIWINYNDFLNWVKSKYE